MAYIVVIVIVISVVIYKKKTLMYIISLLVSLFWKGYKNKKVSSKIIKQETHAYIASKTHITHLLHMHIHTLL